MTQGVIGGLLGGLLLAGTAMAAPPPANPQSPSSPGYHIVRPGDTLWDIAEDYLGDARAWRRVRDLNHLSDPYRLQPDTKLILEENSPLSIDVLHLEGEVWAEGVDGERQQLLTGMRLDTTQAVVTGPFAFVSLRLEDGSQVVLPSSSRVRFAKERDRGIVRVRLESGAVESKVTSRPGEEHYQVETPVGIIGVRGTHFRVREQTGAATTSVLRGAVAISHDGHAQQQVREGEGGRLDSDGRLMRVALLPAPTLLPDWRGAGGVLHARVESLPGAVLYRLQMSRDSDFIELVREAVSDDGEFKVEDVPAGAYHVRLSAVDANGIEGREAHHVFFLRGVGAHR
ncbi:peptidoglycan-binding LysM [Alcanivorax xiamenensis]|uniref:Peptidoglycan-binding LysM n=1 Tax=Alcanivorax xiamenensis TaxID=1177156 RepID=A0ABQ6YBU7_9GAMM|nr:FecR domain-containing protein [Alcanivorax xiamenensis]KAF0807601.1 peptidoglycan-binding LysM [Alcanivorax xiamenensis]